VKQKLCPKCNQALRVLVWDSVKNILFCDNDYCFDHHAPVSNSENKPPLQEENLYKQLNYS
jgi:hypothetical protein